MEKSKVKNNLLKVGFGVSVFLFVLPSILYFFRNGNTTFVENTLEYKFLLVHNVDDAAHLMAYLAALFVMIFFYSLVIKKYKDLFTNINSIYRFIIIISIICVFSVPFMSSDIYYYLGTGRLASEYNQNPYYTDIKSYVENNQINLENDSVMETGYKNYWAKTTVVYGSVWSIICTIVAFFSFGSLNAGILIFKLLNVLIHILNCILLYKMSKKKIFPLIYGLNPFVLVEGIVNVHNDIYMVFFILFALYLVYKKKNLVSGLFSLAMATDIKYVAILLLPLVIIYYYRDRNIKIRFLKCVQYGLLFAVFAMIPYCVYIKDLAVFNGLFEQQSRYAKGLYCYLYVRFPEYSTSVKYIRGTLVYFFIIMYIIICIKLLTNEKIKWYEEIRKLFIVLLLFLFVMITNFQPWYFVWLSTMLVWQKSCNIKWMTQIQIVTLVANAVFVFYSEAFVYVKEFFEIFVLGILMCLVTILGRKVCRMRRAEAKISKIDKSSNKC